MSKLLSLRFILIFLVTYAPCYAAYAAAEKIADEQTTDATLWETVAQDNLLYIEVEQGRITILLADFFAPKHVTYIKALVNEGFYTSLPFYRVLENFVVQGGDASGQKASKIKQTMQAEFERNIDKSQQFTLLQQDDLLAEQTGFINGFTVGRSLSEDKEWLIHCPGTINLARATDVNSGTTDFAIMFGTPPRHLDRNMSVFGRIIAGWDVFYQINRGSEQLGGGFASISQATVIKRMYLGSDKSNPMVEQILIENTDSATFEQKIANRRKYTSDFYIHKGNGNLDVCYFPVKVAFSVRQ